MLTSPLLTNLSPNKPPLTHITNPRVYKQHHESSGADTNSGGRQLAVRKQLMRCKPNLILTSLFCLWLNTFLLTSTACTATRAVQVFSKEPTTDTQIPFPYTHKRLSVLPGKQLLLTCKQTYIIIHINSHLTMLLMSSCCFLSQED